MDRYLNVTEARRELLDLVEQLHGAGPVERDGRPGDHHYHPADGPDVRVLAGGQRHLPRQPVLQHRLHRQVDDLKKHHAAKQNNPRQQ